MRQVAPPRLWISVAALVLAMALGACSASEAPRPAGAAGRASAVAAQCPQPRDTARAPDSYYFRTNPLPGSPENVERGRVLYQVQAKPLACAACHGANGDGKGPEGRQLVPAPRNFSCAETMARITDGQMFWVIENGSATFHLPSGQGAQEIERPGRGTRFTGMRGHKLYLSDTDIWLLIRYVRTLARA